MEEEKDEIDLFLDSRVKTEKELLQEKCEKIYNAASNQTRRDIMRAVCFLGKRKEELLKETGLDEASLKLHLEILINTDFLFQDQKGVYRLTELGLKVLPKL
jgi:predicted transcriptional regulator